MKKTVFSAVSVAALMMAGVAFAQDTSTSTNNGQGTTTTTMPSTTDQNAAQTTTDQNAAQTNTGQNNTTVQTTTTQSGTSGLTVSGMDANNVMMASNLIGSKVYSNNNENVGDINDIIIGSDGRVQGIVIGVGGFLGLGEKDVLVSLDRIQFSRDNNNNNRMIIADSRQDLENAPAFDRTRFMTSGSNTTGTGTTGTGTGTGTTTTTTGQ